MFDLLPSQDARFAAICDMILARAGGRLPPALRNGPPSVASHRIQTLRWHMNDSDVAAASFCNIDKLFPTRPVPRSNRPWHLPRDLRDIRLRYDYQGREHGLADFLERTQTNAFLVMRDGVIVNETYCNDTDAGTRFIGWSLTKSINTVLVGIALEQGLIASADDPITRYLPELAPGAYRHATVAHVLEMRSGVSYRESYDFANPGPALFNHIECTVKGNVRFADLAATIGTHGVAGKRFSYKTIDAAVLGLLIERVSGMTLSAFAARHLWRPLGAEADAFYALDGVEGVGREFSGAGFNATLRDWGRLGQMLLNGGRSDDRHVVDAAWLRRACMPVSTGNRNGRYGMQFWIQRDGPAFKALGLQGQFIYVDPASRTVMVKMSYFPKGDETPEDETERFFHALTRWPAGAV